MGGLDKSDENMPSRMRPSVASGARR